MLHHALRQCRVHLALMLLCRYSGGRSKELTRSIGTAFTQISVALRIPMIRYGIRSSQSDMACTTSGRIVYLLKHKHARRTIMPADKSPSTRKGSCCLGPASKERTPFPFMALRLPGLWQWIPARDVSLPRQRFDCITLAYWDPSFTRD